MKLIINTQIEENYGVHNWDGKGAVPQYWKMKGGTTYVVRNLSRKDADRVSKDGIPTLSELLAESNDGFREYVIGWALVEDNAQECEEWDSPVVLYYDPTYREWKALCETRNDDEHGYMNRAIVKKIERWTLVKGGERKNFKCQYKLRNGELVSSEQLGEALERMGEAA